MKREDRMTIAGPSLNCIRLEDQAILVITHETSIGKGTLLKF